jgi:hypothetical protein
VRPPGLLIALQTPGHATRVQERPTSAKTGQMWGTDGVEADAGHQPDVRLSMAGGGNN